MNGSKDLSMRGMATAIRGLLDTLALEPQITVGHSAGAAILARMSLDGQLAPQSIIALNGAFVPFGGVITRMFSPLAKLLTLNPLVPQLFAWSAGDSRLGGASIEKHGLRGPRSESRLVSTAVCIPTARLEHTRHDGLLGSGQSAPRLAPFDAAAPPRHRRKRPDDLSDDAHLIARIVPLSRTVRLRGVGHLAHEEDPARIAEVIMSIGQ